MKDDLQTGKLQKINRNFEELYDRKEIDIQIFAVPGDFVWQKPAGASLCEYIVVGAGGGGGGGGVANVTGFGRGSVGAGGGVRLQRDPRLPARAGPAGTSMRTQV